MTCKEKLLSGEYREIITDFEVTQEILQGEDADVCTIPVGQGVYVSYLREDAGPRSRTVAEYFMPECFGLMVEGGGAFQNEDEVDITPSPVTNPAREYDLFALIDTGIRQTQLPPLSLTGQGVVIGFLDTGIRYEEQAFRYSDGSSRILGIWDQTIQDGEPPVGQIFGTEYTKEMLDEALASDRPRDYVPTTDTDGHGTALASVAAGSCLVNGTVRADLSRVSDEGTFLGAAPDSMIVMVKLREAADYLRIAQEIPDNVHAYSEGDILMALNYLDSFAISLRRPLVICIGLGSNKGGHNGYNMLSRYIQNLEENRSRALVVCGGNEGGNAHHYEGRTCVREGDAYEEAEIRVEEGVAGMTLELWGRIPQIYAVSVISPSGENFPPGISILEQNLEHQYLYERTQIRITYTFVEESSGDERILIRLHEPTAGIWTIRVYGIGECARDPFHIWLPIQNFLTANAYFLQPSPYVTLTVPAYTREAISVTVYNEENDSFWAQSGRGFSRDDSIRPDMAAPGVNVPTIRGRMTGSSIAAALTAGATAQFMQWAVVEKNAEYVFGRDVRNYLIRGAIREPNRVYPNREWGFGKLNIANTFESLRSVR